MERSRSAEKIAFVLPAIGKKPGQKYIRTWQLMEPLTISTLKALTPPEIETEFYDERIEPVNFKTDANLIAITTEVYTARRAYDIAGRFRQQGKTVILGGYHTTLNPDEAAEHADTVVVGNAETVWTRLLNDYQMERLGKRYTGECSYRNVIPDRSIFAGKQYSRLAVIETGRGCSFNCEFCAISAFHHARYFKKPVPLILREIEAARQDGKKIFFFADDNIVADQTHAIELFKAITPLKIRWTGQGSLTMARNGELLRWMKRSGCALILIGYESLETANLMQMKKAWNRGRELMEELTRRIHRTGLNIYATFLFGFDFDREKLFEETLKFAKRMGFFIAAFNHLLPIPGTELHARLMRENRLEHTAWWLQHGYSYGKLTFVPKQMSAAAVSQHCRNTRKRFYGFLSIARRSVLVLLRNRNLPMFFYFWYLNMKLGCEVDEKMDLPLGENLDEIKR